MATTTMSPILKLPTEILEIILLEAVDEVPPPVAIDFKTGNRSLRWEQELQSGKSILVGMLAPRLVSHNFHKASWKAFGRVLGETLFDLHSPGSLEILLQVSACGPLASWVTKLTIGFYSAPSHMRDEYSSSMVQNHLGDIGCRELRQIRLAERSLWHGSHVWDEGGDIGRLGCDEIYEWHLCSELDTTATLQLLYLVVESLKRFPNIDHLTFSYDETILSARYKSVQRYLKNLRFESDFDTLVPGLGLKIFFHALDDSGVAPRKLEIATNLDWDTITSSTETAVVHRVCQQVEDLTLRHKYSGPDKMWF